MSIDDRNAHGFHLKPGIGWKFDVGKPGGFVIQPSLHLPIVIGKYYYTDLGDFSYKNKTGVMFSFVANFGIGYIF
jgi:hypothetical protein